MELNMWLSAKDADMLCELTEWHNEAHPDDENSNGQMAKELLSAAIWSEYHRLKKLH